MQINVETKFNIGQEVYIIQKARSKEPCVACNGEGHIIVGGNRFSCDKCFGTGRLHGKRKIYQLAGKDTITNIKVYNYLLNTGGHHNEPKTVVKYGFADGATIQIRSYSTHGKKHKPDAMNLTRRYSNHD